MMLSWRHLRANLCDIFDPDLDGPPPPLSGQGTPKLSPEPTMSSEHPLDRETWFPNWAATAVMRSPGDMKADSCLGADWTEGTRPYLGPQFGQQSSIDIDDQIQLATSCDLRGGEHLETSDHTVVVTVPLWSPPKVCRGRSSLLYSYRYAP